MISIEKYTPLQHDQACALSVFDEQLAYTVSDIGEMLSCVTSDEIPHLIIQDGQVVGFFVMDLGYADHYDFSPKNAIGVRALLVDHRFQGQGIAKKALYQLADYTKRQFPTFDSLYLTVNCRNIAAYQCYLKSGFEDTGQLYYGGPVGPQHIMKCELEQ